MSAVGMIGMSGIAFTPAVCLPFQGAWWMTPKLWLHGHWVLRWVSMTFVFAAIESYLWRGFML